MNRRTSAVAAALAVVAVVIAIALLNVRKTTTATDAQASSVPSLPLATARFGTLTSHVRAQGRVGFPAGGDAKLAFAGSGIVARIDVHVGEAVTAGQPLAELDTSGLALDASAAANDAAAASAAYGGGTVPQRALASAQRRLVLARNHLAALQSGTASAQSDATGARSALMQAQAKVAADERTVQREQTLYAGGVAAQKDVEAARQQLQLDRADVVSAQSKAASSQNAVGGAVAQARADVAQAEADVRNAQAQVGVTAGAAGSAQARAAAARRNLTNATLRAPNDGVVSQILKHPGESVDPTQPAIVVGPPQSEAVTVTVSGDAVRAIHPGAAAAVTLAARGGAKAQAVVRSVVPSVDPTTQTSTVVLSGVPPGAANGDAVEVVIDAGEHRGVLIPTDAIVQDPQTGNVVVFVRARTKDGEGFVSREITIGDADGGTTLVTSGLKIGDRLAAHGAVDLLAPSGG
ncbi:hypothetical protein WPS_28150 [Vulcanimicrobium alpinum]|uniref:CzcB-like C-terminal circularly permuted SH3-like domain-containing protein n=1 Tax=Vulcanimicrobium alpinum TaxID=3016050 RepID=A0AAN1XYY8_UNVUL|nr:efflux RND transporter periplasmic adaptor subunit [Vulcanimicrobium alpinum]BDE07539.1 hypothetical protein WPS_28150 [Vulcanimicrobium alpinum]